MHCASYVYVCKPMFVCKICVYVRYEYRHIRAVVAPVWRCICAGQRITYGVCPNPLPFLSQDVLLFTAVYIWLAGPWTFQEFLISFHIFIGSADYRWFWGSELKSSYLHSQLFPGFIPWWSCRCKSVSWEALLHTVIKGSRLTELLPTCIMCNTQGPHVHLW